MVFAIQISKYFFFFFLLSAFIDMLNTLTISQLTNDDRVHQPLLSRHYFLFSDKYPFL